MQQVLLIAAGGSVGALARYGLSSLAYRIVGESFPWGTLLVNTSGAFLIGFLAGLFETVNIPPAWRSFLTIGFLGAFTTFSTYGFETVNLLQDGEIRLASLNILSTNLVGIGCVILGAAASRFLLRLVV